MRYRKIFTFYYSSPAFCFTIRRHNHQIWEEGANRSQKKATHHSPLPLGSGCDDAANIRSNLHIHNHRCKKITEKFASCSYGISVKLTVSGLFLISRTADSASASGLLSRLFNGDLSSSIASFLRNGVGLWSGTGGREQRSDRVWNDNLWWIGGRQKRGRCDLLFASWSQFIPGLPIMRYLYIAHDFRRNKDIRT